VRLKPGAKVVVTIRPATPIELVPEAMALVVLHEDAHLIVIDKPAGLVVHPAPGHATGTLVHGLLAHVEDFGGDRRRAAPGHRPPPRPRHHRRDGRRQGRGDADRAGCRVARQARGRARVRRGVRAAPPATQGDVGTIRTLYGRHPVDRKRFSSKVATGKPAVTHWRVVERLPLATALVRLRLETGRTHQIRVHMSDRGWPLVGDAVYGRRYDGALAAAAVTLGRQALHAARLAFVHPITGARLAFETPPPADFQTLLATLRAAG
jgi:23S rRNA pseudouridine1911/1915/1917 synthase